MRREKGKGLTTGDTKTYAGTRTITLPPSLAALLKERKRAAKTAWIFPDLLRPERPTAPDAAYRRMKLLLEQAGLPDIRFHDLRHTFAPHALTSGVDVKTLSGILGHAPAGIVLGCLNCHSNGRGVQVVFWEDSNAKCVMSQTRSTSNSHCIPAIRAIF